MRILHCSDIHLGRRIVGASGEFSEIRYNDYFKAFEYIVDYAINNNIDVFVIAGDLFDKKEISPDILSRTEKILLKLKTANIHTFVIEGNHDNIKAGKEHESWIGYLESKSIAQRLTYITYSENNFEFKFEQIDNVRFYGLGYPGYFVDKLIENFAEHIEKSDDYINYLIIHTALLNTDIMHGTVKHESIMKLEGKVDYIAGGHFHGHSSYPKNNPFFFVPGSPEMWDFAEYKQKKGFIIFDTILNTKEFIETFNRTKQVLEIEINSSDLTSAESELLNNLNEYEVKSESICFLNISLKNQIEINLNLAEEVLINKGAIKVFPKIIYKLDMVADISKFDSTIEEVETEIIKTWEKFNSIPDETKSLLNNLKSLQNEDLSEEFNEIVGKFLDKIILGKEDDNS
jgi:DNA repair exonuclease SbcCD nuclease subunit